MKKTLFVIKFKISRIRNYSNPQNTEKNDKIWIKIIP